jgi:uncharacterized cupredoxin-like copper-binding protein
MTLNHRSRSTVRCGALVLGAALLLAGCGAAASASPSVPSAQPPAASPAGSGGAGTPVAATLSEYKIELAATTAPAGPVTFQLKNSGTIVHEFVVFKTDLAPDKLPMLADGTAVDEAGGGLTVVDEVEDIAVAATPSLALTLPAGHYVLLCNVATHYKAGMVSEFTTS